MRAVLTVLWLGLTSGTLAIAAPAAPSVAPSQSVPPVSAVAAKAGAAGTGIFVGEIALGERSRSGKKTVSEQVSVGAKAGDTSKALSTGSIVNLSGVSAMPDGSDSAGLRLSGAMDSICLILESAAEANNLPLEFFARVIWQESRFRPDAVGPMTRSGHRAQGIAQFMPYTAGERGLLDPFNPVAALPKAAEFLSELRAEFGNLGLAAAAYNAGPRRVRDYLAGRGGMPAETRHYVSVITGRSVEDWAQLQKQGGADAIGKPTSCRQLAALLTREPSFFVGELERRVREGRLRPWGVQLSAGFSRARVLAAYAGIERRYRALLESLDPIVIGSLLRSRGNSRFYQVRIGVDSRAAADKLCASLHAKGAACMVLKNSRGTPEVLSRRTQDGDEGSAAPAKKDKRAVE